MKMIVPVFVNWQNHFRKIVMQMFKFNKHKPSHSKNNNWKRSQVTNYKFNQDSYQVASSQYEKLLSKTYPKNSLIVLSKELQLQLKKLDLRPNKWNRPNQTRILLGCLQTWQSLWINQILAAMVKVNLLKTKTKLTWKMKWKPTTTSWHRRNYLNLTPNRIICIAI